MKRPSSTWIALGLLLVATAGLVLMHGTETGAVLNDDLARLAALLALLIFIGGGVWSGYRGQIGLALQQAIVWIGIGLALVTLYSFRADLERLARQALARYGVYIGTPADNAGPAATRRSRANGTGTVVIRSDNRHSFSVTALVNGARVDFVADTGATQVVLTPDDARRAGFNTGVLRYNISSRTANGTGLFALVRLDSVRVGSITIRNVSAMVARDGKLWKSLLGMSFLQRLSSFRFQGDSLILKQ